MIKGIGYAALLVFLVLGTQIGSVGGGAVFVVYALLMVATGAAGYACIQLPQVFSDGSTKKLNAFRSFDPHKLIHDFAELANTIRRDGLLASEAARKELSDPFLRYLLKRIMDGYERAHLVQSIRNQSMRTHEVASFVEAWIENTAQALPTAGLIATLFQMIAVLGSTDPNAPVATALVPLLIGVLLQPVVSARLRNPFFASLDHARLYFILMEEGVSGIQEGINAELLRDKLNCRLLESPKLVES